MRSANAIRTTSRIVPAALAALVAAASLPGCGFSSASPIAIEHRINRARTPAAPVRLLLQPEHASLSDRYLAAIDESIETLAVWFPIDTGETLIVVDPPWHRRPPDDPRMALVERSPWWTTATALAPEAAVARAVARRVVRAALDVRALPPWFVDGFAEYAARRVVENRFTGLNNPPGFAFYEGRYFGGFVPRFFRIRMLPDGDGDPLPAFRRQPAIDARAGSPDRLASLTGRATLTFFTLERWIGRPVFDAAVAELGRRFAHAAPTLDDFVRVSSEVSGEDLTWLLGSSLDPAIAFDYGVAELASEPSDEGFHTTVSIARYGDGLFTGRTAPRIGRFESGDGVSTVVTFADGTRVRESWDGRERRKTYEYRSTSRAVSAIVDPDRAIALDLRRTNNSRTLAPLAPVAAQRWSARWQLWLEHLLLTWSALV